jgi:hypothetical protein
MKNPPLLVRNESSKFFQVTCNLLPSGCRIDNLEGREHTVVPMVILTEGVHAGSQGSLYYPKDELSKTPVAWNHKPIVVYHPTLNGEGISACDPAVINTRKIGVMMNTRFEGGRLKSEAWIEKDRANAVDERIMAAVTNKEMMELSTGLFLDVEGTAGKWNKEEYTGIARNFRPDHLALLPDQTGACSIADGAGLLRNQAMRDPAFRGILFKLGLVDNEMSHSDIQSTLMAAVRDKFNVGDNGPFIWVADVFNNFFIYEKDGKFWRLGFTSNDTEVALSNDAPVEVRRKSDWVTVSTTNNNNQNTMNKTQLIAAILAANCGLVEADREALTGLNDKQVEALHNMAKEMPTVNFAVERKDGKVDFVVKNKVETVPAALPAAVPTPASAPAVAAPATNAAQPAAKLVTTQEYIANAPREVQDVLTNAMSVYNDEKKKLVQSILANKRNTFTQQDLENRPLVELRNLAALAAPDEPANVLHLPNYGGQAPVPTGNANKEEALPMPAMNFEKPAKKSAGA